MPRSPLRLTLAVGFLIFAVTACGSASTSPTQGNSEAGSPPVATSASTQGKQGTPAAASGHTPATGSSSSSSAGGIKGILDFGSPASGAEKVGASTAARSFFVALASHDYAKLCAGLGTANREQLQGFLKLKHFQGKACTGVLKRLLVSPQITATARKAAHATVTSVRVKGATAFVIYRPAGGPRSFFVMKRQKGVWKAIGLAPGLPLSPTTP